MTSFLAKLETTSCNPLHGESDHQALIHGHELRAREALQIQTHKGKNNDPDGHPQEHLTWKAWTTVRRANSGLLTSTPAADSARPSRRRDSTTVREEREALVSMKRAQVRRTQLKPMAAIRPEMAARGCLPRPSATIGSKWAAQLTQASFTRRPPASTTQRESV